jgi:hypothetical protein
MAMRAGFASGNFVYGLAVASKRQALKFLPRETSQIPAALARALFLLCLSAPLNQKSLHAVELHNVEPILRPSLVLHAV